jgi:hypothetical protein
LQTEAKKGESAAVAKIYLRLKPSEQVIAQCAAHIYAAYIEAGSVVDGDERHWIERSVREAIQMAQFTDESITSDDEMS